MEKGCLLLPFGLVRQEWAEGRPPGSGLIPGPAKRARPTTPLSPVLLCHQRRIESSSQGLWQKRGSGRLGIAAVLEALDTPGSRDFPHLSKPAWSSCGSDAAFVPTFVDRPPRKASRGDPVKPALPPLQERQKRCPGAEPAQPSRLSALPALKADRPETKCIWARGTSCAPRRPASHQAALQPLQLRPTPPAWAPALPRSQAGVPWLSLKALLSFSNVGSWSRACAQAPGKNGSLAPS